MHVRPPGFDDARLARLLAERWHLEAAELAYAPVGFGGHHWVLTTTSGARRFVTLDERPRARLVPAMRTATALAHAGLEFVVAPLPADDGELVAALDGYAVTVQPYVDGRPWPEHAQLEVAALLARLHSATGAATPYAGTDDLEVDARADLECALRELERPWDAGPRSADLRDLLREAAPGVRRQLDTYDRLAAAVRTRADPVVITHGEPKPDNLLATDAGPRLVDWDTALLAPRGRDVWWLVADPGALERYADLTGRRPHPDDLELYRRRWGLADLALFVRDLRAPHRGDADTDVAWRAVEQLLSATVES